MSALFLYGVLRADIAGEKIEPLLMGLGPGWSATAPGELWAIPDPQGWYPALLPGDGTVQGMLHEAGDVDLAALDAFEGPTYQRTAVTVTSASGELPAMAWLYTAALPDGRSRCPMATSPPGWRRRAGRPSRYEACESPATGLEARASPTREPPPAWPQGLPRPV